MKSARKTLTGLALFVVLAAWAIALRGQNPPNPQPTQPGGPVMAAPAGSEVPPTPTPAPSPHPSMPQPWERPPGYTGPPPASKVEPLNVQPSNPAPALVPVQAAAQVPLVQSAAQPVAFPVAKPVALVNGEAITQAELDAVLKQRLVPASANETQVRQMRGEAVGMLIDDHLIQQYLRREGPKIDDAAIQQWLSQLEGTLKAQGHTLQEFYQERGQTADQIRQSAAYMLQWASYVSGRLSAEELRRYYEDNRDFFEQVSVRASHIMQRLAATASDAERQAARSKLLGLRQEIAAGQLDFSDAARKHSQCPSATQGGDLGYFPRKFALDENFARAAFALKTGEVSDVVETPNGLHLIKTTDRKSGRPSDYEQLKDEVREVATHEMYLKLLARLRQEGKVEILLSAEPALKTPPSTRP